METMESILHAFDAGGRESTFSIGAREYRVFAFRSGAKVRWNLYLLENGATRGLTFGIADGVREAFEDVWRSASRHASTGATAGVARQPRTFRPSPHD